MVVLLSDQTLQLQKRWSVAPFKRIYFIPAVGIISIGLLWLATSASAVIPPEPVILYNTKHKIYIKISLSTGFPIRRQYLKMKKMKKYLPSDD